MTIMEFTDIDSFRNAWASLPGCRVARLELQGNAGVNLSEYQKHAENSLKGLLSRTNLTKKERHNIVKHFRKDVKQEIKSAKRLAKKPTYAGFDATEETGGPAILEEDMEVTVTKLTAG